MFKLGRLPARFQQLRYLSSNPEHLAAWQKGCWDTYISSGRGSDTLFRAIDVNYTQHLSTEEIRLFLDSVDHKGVHNRAFKMLDELAHDHPISLAEFKSWLVIATKFGAETNSDFSKQYNRHPDIGERKPQIDDPDYHSWNEVTMNQAVRKMQYAVRGQVVMRADELRAEGKDILFTNIGNPQAVGQSPITYYRQVLALCDLPAETGVDHPEVTKMFPPDTVQRARETREAIGPAGTGAYSGSQGILQFRKDVAAFIAARDGHPAYPGNIFLTNGASTAIELVLTTLIDNESEAIMIPIPQVNFFLSV